MLPSPVLQLEPEPSTQEQLLETPLLMLVLPMIAKMITPMMLKFPTKNALQSSQLTPES